MRSLFAMGWFAGLVWLIALAVGCQIAHINAPMRRAIESQDQSTITQALRRSGQTPQAFDFAADAVEAQSIRKTLENMELIGECWRYFRWDSFAFIPSYTLALISLAVWGRRRSFPENTDKPRPPSAKAVGAAPWCAVLGALGDVMENLACTRCLLADASDCWVATAHIGYWLKWSGILMASALLAWLGFDALRRLWR